MSTLLLRYAARKYDISNGPFPITSESSGEEAMFIDGVFSPLGPFRVMVQLMGPFSYFPLIVSHEFLVNSTVGMAGVYVIA